MTDDIGRRIAQIREATGLKQQSIADRVGVSLRTWQAIERGENIPTGQTLLKIAELGFDPGWILTGNGFMEIEDSSRAGAFRAGSRLGGDPPDSELMGRVVDTIVRVAKGCGVSIPPVDLGRQAMERYAELMAASSDPAERLAMLKLMAVQIRAELTAPRTPGATEPRKDSA